MRGFNKEVLERLLDTRVMIRKNRIIVPERWHETNVFAFSIEAEVDGKKIPLYRVKKTIFRTLEHTPHISTAFRECKIGRAWDGRIEPFIYRTRSGKEFKMPHLICNLPNGMELELKDLVWNYITIMAGKAYHGRPYKDFEDYIQRRLYEGRYSTDDEGARRMTVAWFTALSIALGLLSISIGRTKIPAMLGSL